MGVQMNIKSVEAVELARELAEIDGISLTDAVTRALRDAKRARVADRSANLPMTLEQQKRFDAVMAVVSRIPKTPKAPWSEIERQFDEINAFAYE